MGTELVSKAPTWPRLLVHLLPQKPRLPPPPNRSHDFCRPNQSFNFFEPHLLFSPFGPKFDPWLCLCTVCVHWRPSGLHTWIWISNYDSYFVNLIEL